MTKKEISQLVVLSFMSMWLLLILLLGDTFLSLYFYGAFSLFFTLFAKKFIKKEYLPKSMVVAICTLILLLFVNLVFSINRASTLDGAITYLMITLVFLFVFLIDKKIFNLKDFSLLLHLITPVLMLLNLFYFLFPDVGVELISKNILYATYGHNHFVGYLLLVIPFFAFAFFKQKEPTSLMLLILSILFTFLSHSRLAIVFLIFQLFFITTIFFRVRLTALFKKNQTSLLLIIATFLLFILIARNSFLIKKIVRPLSFLERKSYWQQAILSSKNNLLFGAGLNNFYILSYRYRQLPWLYSAYAHNFFLNQLAEFGLPATLFFHGLILLTLIIGFKKIKNGNYFLQASYTSFLVSYFYAFVDYDWSFNGIFILAIIVFAFITKDIFFKNKATDHFYRKVKAKLFVLAINIIVILLASFYFLTNLLISQQKTDLAFDLFPYFFWHKLVFLKNQQLNAEQMNRLGNIYANDSDFLLSKINLLDKQVGVANDKQLVQTKKKLFILDPYASIDFNNLDYYFLTMDWSNYQKEIDKLSDFYLQAHNYYDFDLSHTYKQALAQKIYNYSIHLYNQQSYTESAHYLNLARQFEPWIIAQQSNFFNLDASDFSDDQLIFVENLSTIEPKYFAEKISSWTEFHYHFLLYKLRTNSLEKFSFLIDRTIQLTSHYRWQIWQEVLPLIINKAIANCTQDHVLCANYLDEFSDLINKEYFSENLWQTKRSLIRFYQLAINKNLSLWKDKEIEKKLIVMQQIAKEDYYSQAQLAHFYVYSGELIKAKKAYQQCLADFNNQHDDCLHGLSNLAKDQVDKNRFNQVAKIIIDTY